MSEHKPNKTCPICGEDNNCQVGQKECWCHTVKFTKEILGMVPEEKRGKSCICRSCFEKLSQNK